MTGSPPNKKCDTCTERAADGATVRCNRAHPCIWCYNWGLICRYNGVPPPGHENNSDASDDGENQIPTSHEKQEPFTVIHSNASADTLHGDGTRASSEAPPDPSSDAESDIAGKYVKIPSPTRRLTIKRPLRIRGGAENNDDDADEDEDEPPAASEGDDNGHGNDPPAPQSIAERLDALAEQQAALQDMVLALLKDKKTRKANNDSEKPTRESSRVKLRHKPDEAGDELEPGIDARIPHAVWHVFKLGWEKPVPFTMLIDSYCRSKDAWKEPGECLIMGPDNSITTVAAPLTTPNRAEDSLTLPEWLQASARFLYILWELFSRKVLHAWEKHHDFIMTHPRRDDIWPTLLRYDIELRRRATRGAINPAVWQKNIFDEIEAQDIRNERAGRLMAFQTHAAPANSSSTSASAPCHDLARYDEVMKSRRWRWRNEGWSRGCPTYDGGG
ncbi:hypothetical protein FRC06_007864 [Ceratobasidium sp. 370]|nr:hypothetical protein FRC06_007864 [Ceratobasidium sp. 370]